MHNKQEFESGHKGGCGSWAGPTFGRGGFGGPWAGAAFGRGKFGGRGRQWANGFHRPPVNIEETNSEFVISLYAAALVKEKVSLTVKDDVLTISYPAESAVDSAGTDASTEGKNAQTGNYTYQEFSSRAFERQFKLNSKVLTDGIAATYADGILKVTLPKNPATNVPAQTITVA